MAEDKGCGITGIFQMNVSRRGAKDIVLERIADRIPRTDGHEPNELALVQTAQHRVMRSQCYGRENWRLKSQKGRGRGSTVGGKRNAVT